MYDAFCMTHMHMYIIGNVHLSKIYYYKFPHVLWFSLWHVCLGITRTIACSPEKALRISGGPFVRRHREAGGTHQVAHVFDVGVNGSVAGRVALIGDKDAFTNRTLDTVVHRHEHHSIEIESFALHRKEAERKGEVWNQPLHFANTVSA